MKFNFLTGCEISFRLEFSKYIQDRTLESFGKFLLIVNCSSKFGSPSKSLLSAEFVLPFSSCSHSLQLPGCQLFKINTDKNSVDKSY